MSVRVILVSMFAQAADGLTAVELNGCGTAGDCLKQLSARFPKLGTMLFDDVDLLSDSLNVLVNGHSIGQGPEILGYRIKDGDEICPLMMIGGG
jgi:hypothetical protein